MERGRAGGRVATAIGLLAPGTTMAAVPAWQIALAALAAAVTIHGKLHPALVIVAGAIAGIALGR